MVISCALLPLSVRNKAHGACIKQRFACSQVFQRLHVVVIRQFSHDFDIDLLMLVLYHDTEIIRNDMVLLGTPGYLTRDCQTRPTHSTKAAYIVKVGKGVARGRSLEAQNARVRAGHTYILSTLTYIGVKSIYCTKQVTRWYGSRAIILEAK